MFLRKAHDDRYPAIDIAKRENFYRALTFVVSVFLVISIIFLVAILITTTITAHESDKRAHRFELLINNTIGAIPPEALTLLTDPPSIFVCSLLCEGTDIQCDIICRCCLYLQICLTAQTEGDCQTFVPLCATTTIVSCSVLGFTF